MLFRTKPASTSSVFFLRVPFTRAQVPCQTGIPAIASPPARRAHGKLRKKLTLFLALRIFIVGNQRGHRFGLSLFEAILGLRPLLTLRWEHIFGSLHWRRATY